MSVRLDKQSGVAILVLDQPPVNAYGYSFLRELASVIDEIRADEDIHAVVVTSALEKFFSNGADLGAFANGTQRSRVMTATLAHETFRKMENTPFPFIAAIAGHCLGGCHDSSGSRGAWR
jgi:enoyl-CoA hydratase/carnithine racemase